MHGIWFLLSFVHLLYIPVSGESAFRSYGELIIMFS